MSKDIEETKSIYLNTFKILKYNFQLIGIPNLRPHKGIKEFVRRYRYLLLQYVLVGTVILAELASFLTNVSNLDLEHISEVIECMACYMTCFLTTLKVTFMVYNSDRVYKLNTELLKMWPEEPHPVWIEKLTTFPIFILEKLMLSIHISYMALIQSFNLSPLFINLKNFIVGDPFLFMLPYPNWYPFPYDNYPLYIILYVMHFNAGTWVAAAFAAADSFLYFCITNLCIQFEILAMDITYIVETHHHKSAGNLDKQMDFRLRDLNEPLDEYPYDKDTYVVEHSDELYETLSSCIKRHSFLIELVDDLDTIFGFTILANIISSSVLICLTGFLVLCTKNMTVNDMLEYCISVPTKVLQIGLLCWHGDQIISSSAKVADAVTSCKWYLTDKKFKTAALLMLLRSQKPVSLKAMGFSVVSLVTFTNVCSTAWSYLTLLRTTLED